MNQLTYVVTVDFLNNGITEEAALTLKADDYDSARIEAFKLCAEANRICTREKSQLSFFGLKSVKMIDDFRITIDR